MRWAQLLLPDFSRPCTHCSCFLTITLEYLREPIHLSLRHSNAEFIPWKPSRRHPAIGKNDGNATGPHDFKKPNRTRTGSARTQDKFRPSENFQIMTALFRESSLSGCPIEKRRGIFDQDVRTPKIDSKKKFPGPRSGSTNEREKQISRPTR